MNPDTEIASLPIPRYMRRGQCNRCGWCCSYSNCEHLTFDGEVAICKIYEDRPERCRLFPQAPPILISKCGYYFLDTWENNKVVKLGRDL